MLTAWARRGQVALGALYLALGTVGSAGSAETILLVAGGLLVLIGASGVVQSPLTTCAMVWGGGVLGFAPTIGTVVVPLVALFVLDATLVDTGNRLKARAP
ncbi:MAG TPA: hypothetical protein VFH10_12770 [Nocardioides sp.]|uniref:hypothetical protein n=1 Tax=Nocardioides sp. TaxID=35761 RepID=UPI002D80FAB5|nr:hypothetical protein [Nocardioides sp.]HET6653509.1 hypothetical protein [Nocardioides sp.]